MKTLKDFFAFENQHNGKITDNGKPPEPPTETSRSLIYAREHLERFATALDVINELANLLSSTDIDRQSSADTIAQTMHYDNLGFSVKFLFTSASPNPVSAKLIYKDEDKNNDE